MAKNGCEVCGGKRYLVCRRDDGRYAVERCDACSWFGEFDPRTLFDEDAVIYAARDGVIAEPLYPCIVRSMTAAAEAHWCSDAEVQKH